MKITPLDIRRKEFKRSVRGYADEEVDIFLDEVADEFERLFRENMELQDRVHRQEEQSAGLSQVRETLEKTLITAQVQAEEMKANASRQSELILQDAELKARGIVSNSYGETQKVQQALAQLRVLEEEFRFKFRSLLEGYLKMLSEAPLSLQTSEAPSTSGSAPVQERDVPFREQIAVDHAQGVSAQEPVAPVQDQALSAARAPSAGQRVETYPVVEERLEVRTIDDDSPTQENEDPGKMAAAAQMRASLVDRNWGDPGFDGEATAETDTSERIKRAKERLESRNQERGFFFGRQVDDLDDTFPGEDGAKVKGRDFQW